MTVPIQGPLERISSLNGTPSWLGTIVCTTTKNNTDTATPFNTSGTGLGGKALCLMGDAAFIFVTGITTTPTAVQSKTTGAVGLQVAANTPYYLTLPAERGWIACIPASGSGSTNVQVFEML